MATSAISGRIVFKQGPRAYLDANIRKNSLVFDTDNNIILYSPSGTNYYEFFPGQGSGVSGTVSWNNIVGEPIASVSTSGLLSVSDWNKFNSKVDVSAISGIGSGSGTVSSVGLSSRTLTISNSPITSSGVLSIELSSIGISGTSTKVSYDEFGRVVSGDTLKLGDIPNLSSLYLSVGSISQASTNTSGYLTSSDWNTFNNKADISSVNSVVSANVSSTISAYGFIDMGSYTQANKPLRLSNGIYFQPFVQRYISGTPSVSSMVISAGISQRIQLPAGTSYRLWWYGVGPFAYRTGNSSVVSVSNDFPAMVGYTQILNTTDQYLAVYGIGSGSITIEAGDGAL
jgi:hypothetical protein